MVNAIILMISGVVCILFGCKIFPFNRPEYNIFNPLREKYPKIIIACGIIVIINGILIINNSF